MQGSLTRSTDNEMDDTEQIGDIPLWLARLAAGECLLGLCLFVVPSLRLFAMVLLAMAAPLSLIAFVAGLLCCKSSNGKAAAITALLPMTLWVPVIWLVSLLVGD